MWGHRTWLGGLLGKRGFTWVLSVLLAVVGVLATAAGAWGAQPATPTAAERSARDRCEPGPLADARARTSVVLQHGNRTYSKIVTELTVDVPGAWPLSRDLLLGERSHRYIAAMSCLTRTGPRDVRRLDEWRTGDPVVTWRGDRAEVVYRAHAWANTYRADIDVGLWRFRAGARYWTLRLRVPPALAGSRWDRISVDPGAPGAEWATPRPATGEGATALVWRPDGQAAKPDAQAAKGGRKAAEDDRKARADRAAPSVEVGFEPSWQRSWSAQSGRLIAMVLHGFGRLLWVCLVSALLLVAARAYLRRPGTATVEQRETLGRLRAWAQLAVVLHVVVGADLLVEQTGAHFEAWFTFPAQLFLEYGLALLALLLLFRFADWYGHWAPWLILLLNPVTVVLAVGLPIDFVGPGLAMGVQSFVAFSFVALTLLAVTAALWRVAVDGRLLPRSRRFPGQVRVLRLRAAGAAAVGATVAIAVCYVLAEELDWLRISWLSDATTREYGADHLDEYMWQVMWSVSFLQELIVNDQAWLLTAVAALAVLRAWRLPGSLTPLDDPADRVLFLTFFAVAAGASGGTYLENALLSALWIPLNMLALYGTVVLLARRSVLAQPFVLSGRPLAAAAGPAARTRLLGKARAYREIHAELRRLDQGLFGDVPPKRDQLERRLEKLHEWPVSAPLVVYDRLPGRVSVVDTALALGPRDDWWGNGVRGARFSLVPGVPAALLGVWAWRIRGEGWQDSVSNVTGLPSLAFNLLYWLVGWSAAGFVLGALWRVLPGRRGAVKALPVALAFGLPLGLDALLGLVAGEGTGNAALHFSMMLFVLTVTAIALDFDTFGGERRYWQSRMGLLLSVYQMRYYSLQVAYLVAQVIAMITIWQFFAEPDVAPSRESPPPESGGGGSGSAP